MFSAIANFFTRGKKERERLQQQLADMQVLVTTLSTQVQTLQPSDNHNSDQPWVELKSVDYDPVKGVKIELDWNDAFIQYLHDNGISGDDHDDVVQKWLTFLYQDLAKSMQEQAITRRQDGKGEFQ